jgi:hypothetical protein
MDFGLINPSWATDAINFPSLEKIFPQAKPRAFEAFGDYIEYNKQSSKSKTKK